MIQRKRRIHIVGFGSQGSAWAHCLQTSGWEVQIYLNRNEGQSYEKAVAAGFHPRRIEEFPLYLNETSTRGEQRQEQRVETDHWVALLCPDATISEVYHRHFSHLSTTQIQFVLAHGYAVFSKELNPASILHSVHLLAPKAIGPKLKEAFETCFPKSHSLAAAIQTTLDADIRGAFLELAMGLGFNEAQLIPTSFEKEALGDLMSEQGLLCGGIFNLLEWTMEAMAEEGIPDALIREECLTELELIAGMIRSKGPGTTFKAISQAAQCGTVSVLNHFQNMNLKEEFKNHLKKSRDGSFIQTFRSGLWRQDATALNERLTHWETRLMGDKK